MYQYNNNKIQQRKRRRLKIVLSRDVINFAPLNPIINYRTERTRGCKSS